MARVRRRKAARKVHSLGYSLSPKDSTRRPGIHERRDQTAALQLQPVLAGLGYEPGEPIFNSPPASPRVQPPYQIDLSFVAPGDLLLHTTRPPMDDEVVGGRKKIDRAQTDLEDRIFGLWRRYLERCARYEMVLQRWLYDLLPAGYESHREMHFYERTGAPYKSLNDRAGSGNRATGCGERRTAAFLLRVDEAWEGGPGYLGAFGLDGVATLVWACRLRRDLCDLLARPGFVFAELENTGIPD